MVGKIAIFCTFFVIFGYWSDLVLKFDISGVKGLSVANAGFYLSLISWCIVVVKRKKLFIWSELYIYFLILIFIAVLSIPIKILNPQFIRVNIIRELVSIKSLFEGYLIFVIFYNIYEEKYLCKSAIWGLLFLFLLGNVTMLLNWFDIIKLPGLRKSWLLETSGFGNPNDYAAFMLLFFPILFSSLITNKKTTHRLFIFMTLLLSIWAFIMTGSRGAFLSFLFTGMIYLYLIKRFILVSQMTKLLWYLFIIIPILIIPILFLPSAYVQKMSGDLYSDEINSINDYSHGRGTFWIGGLEIFMDSPVYGHGMKTFPTLLQKKKGVSAVAHNRYLLILVEFGLIGIISYMLLQLALLKKPYKMMKGQINTQDKIIFLNFFTGTVGLFIAIFFVDAWVLETPFWIYSAAIFRYSQLSNID